MRLASRTRDVRDPSSWVDALRFGTGLVRAAGIHRWQLGHLGSGVMIGARCRFLNGKRISIGDRCSIQGPARLEVVLLDSTSSSGPILRIRDDVTIEQNVHVVASTSVDIGPATSISANVSIVDLTHPIYQADGTPSSRRVVRDVAPVTIGEGVFIGVGAVILPGVEIGEGARIGANAVVTHNVPAYASVAGVPARLL